MYVCIYSIYIYGIDISFYHQSLSYENFAAHQTSAAQRSPAYSTIQVDGRWLASMPWVMDNSPLEQRSSNPGKLQTNVETHGKTDGLPYKNDPQCWADSTSMFVYKVPWNIAWLRTGFPVHWQFMDDDDDDDGDDGGDGDDGDGDGDEEDSSCIG